MTRANQKQSRESIEGLLTSLAEAVQAAAADVDYAQEVLREEALSDEWSAAEDELRRTLRAIEDNLTDSSIGLRMFMAGDRRSA